MTPLDIQNIPQIPNHRTSNRQKDQLTTLLAAKHTSEPKPRTHHPPPPSRRKRAITLLVKFNVRMQGECDEEEKGGVEEDELGLGDVCVV